VVNSNRHKFENDSLKYVGKGQFWRIYIFVLDWQLWNSVPT